MENSIILNNPLILIGFAVALCLCIFTLIKKAHRSVTVISVLIFTGTLTYALLKGAGLYEAGAVATIFFIINLLPLWKRGDKK